MSRYRGKRRAPRRRSTVWPVVITLTLVAGSLAGWLLVREADPAEAEQRTHEGGLPPGVDPATPTGWGPTEGELAEARQAVTAWSAEQLAGQVIVGRWHGTDPEVAAEMVRDLHLAGLSMQSENVVDAEQVRATNEAVAEAVADSGRTFPPVIGVDQEGGTVSHLRGIATEFPAYAEAGDAIEADAVEGTAVVREAAAATGLELRDLGFTWVFAPVADVTIGYDDPTIRSRSAGEDPEVVATATAASVGGFNDVGVVSTTKHFPGHGAVPGDSHHGLPVLDSSLEELRERDLVPFEAAVEAGAPTVMMSHVDVEALAPGVPATHAPELYDFLADDLGFDGLVITDSLGMGAVMGQDRPAVGALLAGADLLLMPADTARTHRTLVRAIESGEVPRERILDAAATVVAVQMWQARVAASVPVPEDVEERAEAASDALSYAG